MENFLCKTIALSSLKVHLKMFNLRGAWIERLILGAQSFECLTLHFGSDLDPRGVSSNPTLGLMEPTIKKKKKN